MSFRKFRALVIEDEQPIREVLVQQLNKTNDFEVVGEADSVEEGFVLVKETPADVLFLDIEFFHGTAFQLLSQLKREGLYIPPVVINTGYTEFEYAQKIYHEFKEEVISILKKPFYKDWEKHQEKILDAIYVKNQTARMANQVPIRKKMVTIQDGRLSYQLNPEDIIMVRTGAKGQGKTQLAFEKHELNLSLSLSQLLAKLPSDFIQINRFEAINIAWISLLDHAEKEVKLRNGEICCIGTAFYPGLCEWVER